MESGLSRTTNNQHILLMLYFGILFRPSIIHSVWVRRILFSNLVSILFRPAHHFLKGFPEVACPSVKPPVRIKICPVVCSDLLNNYFINATFTQNLFLDFFPDTPFPVLLSVVVCHPYFLQSKLIERARKAPHFPKGKKQGG